MDINETVRLFGQLKKKSNGDKQVIECLKSAHIPVDQKPSLIIYIMHIHQNSKIDLDNKYHSSFIYIYIYLI